MSSQSNTERAFALVHFTLHKAATYLFHAFILICPLNQVMAVQLEMIHLLSHFPHLVLGCKCKF